MLVLVLAQTVLCTINLQWNSAHPARDGRELRSVGYGRVHVRHRSPPMLTEAGMIRKRHSRWWTNYNCGWSGTDWECRDLGC